MNGSRLKVERLVACEPLSEVLEPDESVMKLFRSMPIQQLERALEQLFQRKLFGEHDTGVRALSTSILHGQGSEMSDIVCKNGSAFMSGKSELFGICRGQPLGVAGCQDITIAVGEDTRK